MCQEGCPMMRHLLGHLHEHGITLGVPPNGWEAPHHCARDTSTNVVPPVGGRTVQGILLPMCIPLMATLVKGDLPCILGE